MKTARAKKKLDAEMIMQIMTQISEEYKVVAQAIWIMSIANQTPTGSKEDMCTSGMPKEKKALVEKTI